MAANRSPARKRKNTDDLRAELLRYSKLNEYVAKHFAQAVCKCGGRGFELEVDDTEGAAIRRCVACKHVPPIGDSADYLDEADLEACACPCGGEVFEIAAAVALYAESEDVRWIYLACRCVACRLVAVYADWKCEYPGYRELLAKI